MRRGTPVLVPRPSGPGWSALPVDGHSAEMPPGRETTQHLRRRARGGLLLARDVEPEDLALVRRDDAWRRLRRGAYLAPPDGGAEPPHAERRRAVLARIAAVHADSRSAIVFSHTSAALLWRCELLEVLDEVHVTQRSRSRSHRDPAVVRHHAAVPDVDRDQVGGFPVTSLARTAVDCACLLSREAGVVVADAALRAGADGARVGALLRERAGGRGIARAREVLAFADGRSESPGESLTRWHLARHGVPAPQLQVPVETASGRFRSDLGWPDARLLLEFDGYVKYSGGGARAAADAVFAEKRRQDALEEAGWRVLRVTWTDLRTPAALARRVRAALDGRTRPGGSRTRP